MSDPDELLITAIEQIKTATNQLKQKHTFESNLWQKKSQELQTIVNSLQSELRLTQQANSKMKASLDESRSELERLRGMLSNLTQTLQEKDQSLAHYITLNQSLRGLLDAAPRTPPVVTETPRSPKRSPQKPPPINESSPTKGSSRNTAFIKSAKNELTYSDFNQLIAEINLYNKHQQSRDETISNVKRLLYPTHRKLFDQFLLMIGAD